MRYLTSRWVLTAVGVLAAGLSVWVFGPFLSLLQGTMPRVLAMLVIAMAWMTINTLIDLSRQRMDQRLTAGVTQTADAPAAGAEDVAEQRDRLTRALHLLRQASGKRGYLYEQPWYVIIGPPGSGKTTALANSGLRFPFAAELNGGEIRGVGGTRYCDWSFTDEAVLIDTAGRYTTHSSDAATDKAGWQGFLDLLRRNRPRQPLNGVIVAIAISEIAQAPDAERLAHARAIRERLKELYTKLAARMPVYVLFTKMDLIQGFTDFFDDLDRTRRAQVWGTTFPAGADHAGPVPRYAQDFRALTAQLSVRVVDRLQAERSLDRRAAIGDFPTQFASLETPVVQFLDAAFTGTRLDPAVLLRGVYFVSGTQEGSPIDRLTGTLARTFGIDQRRTDAIRPTQGRGYFLETLFKGVIFQEAMLVASSPHAIRRRMLMRGGAWGLSAIILFGGLGLLGLGWAQTTRRQSQFDQALAEYRQAAMAVPNATVPLGGSDLPQVLPLLNRARDLRQAAASPAQIGATLDLASTDKFAAAADDIYDRALKFVLLPRLISEVELQLRNRPNDLDALYRATRVYLMLCGQHPMDAALVRDWALADWASIYHGASLDGVRADLAGHLQALVSRPLRVTIAPQGDLLLQAQRKLQNIDVPDRAYALLRSSEAAHAVRPFVPSVAIGAQADSHFVRRSGRSLQDPISGLYTLAGYQTVVLPEMARATDQAIRDSWVLGRASEVDPNSVTARQAVEQTVMLRYAHEYRAAWDGLLDDLETVTPTDPGAANAELSVEASPSGPITLLLTAMVKELELTQPAPPAAAAAKAPDRVDAAVQDLNDHYRDLRRYVEHGLADQLRTVAQLQQQIEQQLAASATAGPAQTPGLDAAQALSRTAAAAPQPVSRWLQTLAQRGGAARDDARRLQADAAYGGSGGALPLCQAVVQKFPFRPNVHDDVRLSDFNDLFAPNGRLDTFFARFVRPYVDTTGKDWKLRDPLNSQVPVSADGVAQFQRAQAIRDTFFGFGGTTPDVKFAVRPVSLDSGATEVTLDFGGLTTAWKPSGTTSVGQFDWPGGTQMTSVGATFDPPGSGADLRQTGPWALFRFVNAASLQKTGGGATYLATIRQTERQAQFELSAASARNPFDPELFRGFHCPALQP